MKNYSFLIILFFFLSQGQVSAQKEHLFERNKSEVEHFYSYKKEIGLDFTPLISKLIPFNLSDSPTGLVGLRYKKYRHERAFRMNLGAFVENNFSNNFLYFSIGIEKRHSISPKWNYTSGWDLYGFAEDSNFDSTSGVGIAKFYGFEFNISNNVFLATEANLQFFIDSDNEEFNLKLNVPQSIFLFMRF